jgi:hypothetical protein
MVIVLPAITVGISDSRSPESDAPGVAVSAGDDVGASVAPIGAEAAAVGVAVSEFDVAAGVGPPAVGGAPDEHAASRSGMASSALRALVIGSSFSTLSGNGG